MQPLFDIKNHAATLTSITSGASAATQKPGGNNPSRHNSIVKCQFSYVATYSYIIILYTTTVTSIAWGCHIH